MKTRPGSGLLLLCLVCLLFVSTGREAFRKEGPPAFFVDRVQGTVVGLGSGFPRPGIHRFSDGTAVADVIKLTNGDDLLFPEGAASLLRPLQNGMLLELEKLENQKVGLHIKWLPAGQRIALGIPLHPDRMEVADWEVLPGIGAKLAWGIEKDRQENGDFGAFEALMRVRGIGPKRIQTWKDLFVSEQDIGR